jgi:hypothetical protein
VTRREKDNTVPVSLYTASVPAGKKENLAFVDRAWPRHKVTGAGDPKRLHEEIGKEKDRFGMSEDVERFPSLL